MAKRFVVSGGDKAKLDIMLNKVDSLELQKLVVWGLDHPDYTFDNNKKSQVFRLIEDADSEDWLAELVVKLNDTEKHRRLMSGLTDIVEQAKEAVAALPPAARPYEPPPSPAEAQSLTSTTQPADTTGPDVSPESGVLLTAELLAMEEEYYSTQWWNKEDLAGFVDRWQDLLSRAHAAVIEWRRARWRPSASADVRQLSMLDAIEVASQAFDEAEATFIGLLDFQHLRDVSAHVFFSRRAIRCLVVAVEDVVNLRAGAAGDVLGADMCDGPPLSVPTAALTDAATAARSISKMPTALRDAAPFVAAVASYVSRTVRSSEDSLAAIARLVAATGACAERAQNQMTLSAEPDDARWRSAARQLSEDASTVLTELNIYWKVRRRQEQQDLAQPGSPERLEAQLRELAVSRDGLRHSFHQLSRHLDTLHSGFASISASLLESDQGGRDHSETQSQVHD